MDEHRRRRHPLAACRRDQISRLDLDHQINRLDLGHQINRLDWYHKAKRQYKSSTSKRRFDPTLRVIMGGARVDTHLWMCPGGGHARYEDLGSNVIPRRARPGLAGLGPHTRA